MIMPPISLLIKPASSLCNMKCNYCFYCDLAKNRRQASFGVMDQATLEVIIKKALFIAEHRCTFGFQGGEPTLAGLEFYENVISLQKKHNINRVAILNTIQTNGLDISEEWSGFFAENDFLVGLSLDGIKRTHDANRRSLSGGTTFERILRTAELLNRCKVEYNILTVVNKYTAREVKRIYGFFRKYGFRFLQFIPCLDPLNEIHGKHDYSLTPEAFGTFLCELFDLWFVDLLNEQQPYIRAFENYIAILLGLNPDSCDMLGICSNQYVVEADGSVYPCDFFVLDEYRLGSFLSSTFDDFNRKASNFVEPSRMIPKDCNGCPYYYVCRGGCRRNRILASDGAMSNYFCTAYKQFFAHSLERMIDIAEAIRH